MQFDLLDKPLVYITVNWPGIAADDDGNAKVVDQEVQIQVEMLDSDELQDWLVFSATDPLNAEKVKWNERANAANVALDAGEDGSAEQVLALAKEYEDLQRRGKPLDDARNLEAFKRVAHGWRGIKANGKVPKFDDENISRLLKFGGFNAAFGTAYSEAYKGRVKTRTGNSSGSAEHGQAAEPSDATRKDETKPTPPAS